MNEPWNIPNSPWKDEKAYLSWLRGSIRRIWSRHPVKIAYKQSRRYKAPVGRNDKEVWVSDCEICGKQSRDCDVDHLKGGFGFTDWASFTEWARMILWVTFDDIRELCSECHGLVTYCQKNGCTWEEAGYQKFTIALVKDKKDVAWLKEKGYTPATSSAKRRLQIVEILKMESENESSSDRS